MKEKGACPMMQSAAAALPVATAASQGRPGEPRCEQFFNLPPMGRCTGAGKLYIYGIF